MKENITIQFIPHSELASVNSENKLKKILKIVKENKIVIIEGKLKADEEAKLIENTMKQIDKSFKGIEIASFEEAANFDFFYKIKSGLARMLLGDKFGLSIIGPATLVKEIKRDPSKIELMVNR
ncbi:DUF2073 domain-containing protein [Candidatus Woesearchaeota archaeon]|nr:DUF2073 domain-containing protein [Candidatus Woesearchaeota archaeon]